MSPRIIKLSCIRPADNPAVIGESHNEPTPQDMARAELRTLEKRAAQLRQEIRESEGKASGIVEKARKEADSIRREAESVMANARAASETELNKSREEIEQLKQQSKTEIKTDKVNALEKARVKGHKEGMEQGLKEAAEKSAEMFSHIESILAEAEKARAEALSAAKKDVLDLAIAVARKVTSAETRINPEIILNNIREAIRRVNDKENVTLVISPEDLKMVEDNRDDILHTIAGLKHVRVVEDPAIERGGLVIETNYGTIDACVSSQLAELEKALREEVGQDD